MSTATLTDLEHLLDDVGTVACQSVLHMRQGKPTHEGIWYASSPCGGIIVVCEARRALCRQQGGWRCTTGCHHLYEHITFTRL